MLADKIKEVTNKMNRNVKILLLMVLAAALVGVPSALGWPGYLDSFNAQYNTAGTSLGSCNTCHYSDFTRNPYGSDFASNGHNFTAIESMDSDGDTFTNIEEITAGTFPGDASSYPTPPAVPVLTTIAVSPATATLDIAGTQVFTATALDQNGSPMSGIDISWTSSNTSVGDVTPASATTDAGGNATTTFIASDTGAVTVTAANGTTSGTASVTVNAPITPPAGTSTVIFVVTDNATGLPIDDTKVRMAGTKIETDDAGTAIFTNITPGEYKYKVSAEDYVKSKGSVSVTGDTTVTVSLTPATEDEEDSNQDEDYDQDENEE